jgi:trimethylamine---corrinoid protein Co-methyltransferase
MKSANSCEREANLQVGIELNHLGPAHIEAFHQATLDLLDRTGVIVAHQDALTLLKAAGARVEGQRVRIPPHLVEAALASAPRSIDIYDRLGRVAMRLGGRNCYFGTGSDLPSTIDPETRQHRRSGKQDVARIARLCDGLENIDFCMSMAIASDASSVTSYVHQFDAMVRSTAKPLVFTANNAADMHDIFELGATVVGGAEELSARPRYVLYNEPISPLYHTPDGVDKLLFAARHNIPVIYIGSPMTGASGPVTLSGCIAQASAESLSGLVIHQLGARGAPFVYGADASILDMRSMIYAYGAPELQIMDVAFADLARHYGLPLFCIGGASDSKTVDAQAGAEMAFSLLISALNGCNLIHDVGYLESGLCSSDESIVLADELIGYAKRILAAYRLTADDLALDVIGEVGPRGAFLEHEHTLTRYRQVAWRPKAFNRQTYEAWRAEGAEPITTALRRRAASVIEAYRPPELSRQQLEAMDAVLARRG